MQDGGHERSPCPQVEPDKRAAVLSCDAPLLQPVHSQYTKRPLTALKHRYPQRRLLEQYQRFTRLSTTTSDPDNDLPVLSSYIERGSPPSTTSPPTRFKGSLSQWTRSRRAWQTTCRRCAPMRGKSALVGIKGGPFGSVFSPWKVLGRFVSHRHWSTGVNAIPAGQSDMPITVNDPQSCGESSRCTTTSEAHGPLTCRDAVSGPS